MNKIVMVPPADFPRCKTVGDLLGLSGAKELGITVAHLEHWVHPALGYSPAQPVTETEEVIWVTTQPNIWEPPRPAYSLEVKKEFQEQFGFESLIFYGV